MASNTGHTRTAPACVLCLVSELLLAALMAVAGVLNHNATATCAVAGISSSSTEGHPRRSKTPLDFGVSSGPSTLDRENGICQLLDGRCAESRFRDKFSLEVHDASPCVPGQPRVLAARRLRTVKGEVRVPGNGLSVSARSVRGWRACPQRNDQVRQANVSGGRMSRTW